MIDDKQRIQMLTYALGLAIGALETVNLQQYDFNKAGVENVLRRLKLIADWVETPKVFDKEEREV